MKVCLPALTAVLALGIGAFPASAQEQASETSETATEEAAAPASPREAVQAGEPYLLDSFKDWSMRCIRIDEIEDPCEIHLPLNDSSGTRTAEINIFPLQQGEVVAGATIVTPLETLLPRGIRLSVDGGQIKEYPFTFCNRVGCVAQVGFTGAEVEAFKRGNAGLVSIFPVAAPDQVVNLTMSLSGFTAAFTAINENTAAQ